MAKDEPFSIFKDPQKGIADGPHLGIADMRCVNIHTSPGSVAVNFKTTAMTMPPTVSALAFTATTDDLMTVASTTGWYNGMALTLNSIGTATGIATGRVYWVGDLTATTFKLYSNPSLGAAQLIDITAGGSGTLSSYTMGAPLDKAYLKTFTSSVFRPYAFILDSNGRVWWVKNNGGTVTNNLVYLGNDTLTSASTGRGLVVFNQDLVVFRSGHIDKLDLGDLEGGVDLDGVSGWEYAVETVSASSMEPRPLLAATDNNLYYGAGDNLGSFDTSYTKTSSVLDFPNDEQITALGEIGTGLIIGGIRNLVYHWDTHSPSFDFPTTIPEYKTFKIVTTNQKAYLLAGNRGNIYVTDGFSTVEFKKIPDYVTGEYEPYFVWGDAVIWKGRLFLTFSATKNDTTALTTTGGVWAIDLDTAALFHVHKLSYDTYAGTAPVLLPNVLTDSPAGTGLYIGWTHSGSNGVDVTSSLPYANYETRIDTALYPVGTILKEFTPDRFLYRLVKPLVSGEGVKLYWRENLTDAFNEFKETTTAGLMSDWGNSEFTNAEFVQLRIELKSTATTPSYVPLNEVFLTHG